MIAAGILAGLPSPASAMAAEAYPARPVRVIVAFSPGGAMAAGIQTE